MKTSWEILSKTQQDADTVVTEVRYQFDDNTPFIISIAHFRPESDVDILIGIANRAVSERRDRLGEIGLDIMPNLPSDEV
jgi:hypothetical protein